MFAHVDYVYKKGTTLPKISLEFFISMELVSLVQGSLPFAYFIILAVGDQAASLTINDFLCKD